MNCSFEVFMRRPFISHYLDCVTPTRLAFTASIYIPNFHLLFFSFLLLVLIINPLLNRFGVHLGQT